MGNVESLLPPIDDLIRWRWRQVGRTTSTQDLVIADAEEGAPAGLVICADEQTAGRGRLHHRWESPPGVALLCSLLLRPEMSLEQSAQLTMIAGLALTDAILELTSVVVDLKWPNDLYVQQRKLGGILTETAAVGNVLRWAVVGFGLNVRAPFPPEHPLAQQSTSLQAVCAQLPSREALLRATVCHFAAYCRRRRDGWSPHVAWAGRLITLGQQITIAAGGERWQGMAVGVTPAGALRVRRADGRLDEVWGGEVSLSPRS